MIYYITPHRFQSIFFRIFCHDIKAQDAFDVLRVGIRI